MCHLLSVVMFVTNYILVKRGIVNYNQDFLKSTFTFFNSWLYGFERKHLNMNDSDYKCNICPRVTIESEEFAEIFANWIETVEIIEKIKKSLTARIIDPSSALKIHGLSNRQLTYWEDKGIMPFKKAKGKRRKYSVVDIAWIIILKQFQDRTNSLPQSISEQIRYLLDEDVLALCLIRDIKPSTSIVTAFPSPQEKSIIHFGADCQYPLETKLSVIIPITSIVEYVLSLSGNIGLSTFKVDGKRSFRFAGNLNNINILERMNSKSFKTMKDDLFIIFKDIGNGKQEILSKSLES